jgi:hypothetical protein
MDVEICTPGLNANDDRRSFMEKHTEFSVRSQTGSDAPHQAVNRPIIIRSDKCDWSAASANSAVAVNRPVAADKCDWNSDSNVLSRSAASTIQRPVIGADKCDWSAASANSAVAVNRPVAADKCDWNSDSNVLSRSAASTIQRPVIGADKCDWIAVGVERPGLSAAINRPVIGADKCDWVAQSYVPFRATPERTTPVVQPGA